MVNGKRAETNEVPGTGTWRFDGMIDTVEGSNTVTVEARDASDNVKTDSWEFSVGSVEKSLSYDLSGNLLSDGVRTYTWDAKNRLKSVTVGEHAYSWEYDAMDRRVREKKDNVVEREWVWDDLMMIQERSGGGVVSKAFFYQGALLNGVEYFYTRDHLGSIREIVDFNGIVKARYDYDLWGKREKVHGNLDGDFGFTGHYQHIASGLTLAPYRAYDADLGRWINRDPIEEEGGVIFTGMSPIIR